MEMGNDLHGESWSLEAKFYWMTTNRHLTKEQIRELRKTLKSFTNELKLVKPWKTKKH